MRHNILFRERANHRKGSVAAAKPEWRKYLNKYWKKIDRWNLTPSKKRMKWMHNSPDAIPMNNITVQIPRRSNIFLCCKVISALLRKNKPIKLKVFLRLWYPLWCLCQYRPTPRSSRSSLTQIDLCFINLKVCYSSSGSCWWFIRNTPE